MSKDWQLLGPVEILTTDGIISIRSASDKIGDELVLDRNEWNEFIRIVKDGDLDHI